jgi:hypothetical protein
VTANHRNKSSLTGTARFQHWIQKYQTMDWYAKSLLPLKGNIMRCEQVKEHLVTQGRKHVINCETSFQEGMYFFFPLNNNDTD